KGKHGKGAGMEREFLHLERILTVYEARGQEALKALEDEDWATFEELMRKRRAAFHNFRAWDDRLEKQSPGYLAEARWQGHWQAIQKNDAMLAAKMELHKNRYDQQLARIRKHRTALNKFHSGVQHIAGFQETV
ncbi:MAG: hypothetical protein ACOVS5_18235, partial [Oligoflexus sp.]